MKLPVTDSIKKLIKIIKTYRRIATGGARSKNGMEECFSLTGSR